MDNADASRIKVHCVYDYCGGMCRQSRVQGDVGMKVKVTGVDYVSLSTCAKSMQLPAVLVSAT